MPYIISSVAATLVDGDVVVYMVAECSLSQMRLEIREAVGEREDVSAKYTPWDSEKMLGQKPSFYSSRKKIKVTGTKRKKYIKPLTSKKTSVISRRKEGSRAGHQ